MGEVIELFPNRQFTDRERAGLCDAVCKHGWFVLFVREPRTRERGFVYRKFPKGDPDWIVDSGRESWQARDRHGRPVASGSGPVDLLDKIHEGLTEDYWRRQRY